MFSHPGAPDGLAGLRPLSQPRALNAPQPLVVQSDASGRPLTVALRGRRLPVRRIEETWRIDDGWWQAVPLSRRYWRVTLADWRTITIFQDLHAGTWWRQHY
ncbi:MAG TPA: hypothetical protein VHS99_26230 [Chloroflexota bacterium]|jgi:hypothetical protein|nr:hypothetical protein [Chloroflexota bacterium]